MNSTAKRRSCTTCSIALRSDTSIPCLRPLKVQRLMLRLSPPPPTESTRTKKPQRKKSKVSEARKASPPPRKFILLRPVSSRKWISTPVVGSVIPTRPQSVTHTQFSAPVQTSASYYVPREQYINPRFPYAPNFVNYDCCLDETFATFNNLLDDWLLCFNKLATSLNRNSVELNDQPRRNREDWKVLELQLAIDMLRDYAATTRRVPRPPTILLLLSLSLPP